MWTHKVLAWRPFVTDEEAELRIGITIIIQAHWNKDIRGSRKRYSQMNSKSLRSAARVLGMNVTRSPTSWLEFVSFFSIVFFSLLFSLLYIFRILCEDFKVGFSTRMCSLDKWFIWPIWWRIIESYELPMPNCNTLPNNICCLKYIHYIVFFSGLSNRWFVGDEIKQTVSFLILKYIIYIYHSLCNISNHFRTN